MTKLLLPRPKPEKAPLRAAAATAAAAALLWPPPLACPASEGRACQAKKLLLPQRLPDEPLAVLQPLIPNLGERERRLRSNDSEHEKK